LGLGLLLPASGCKPKGESERAKSGTDREVFDPKTIAPGELSDAVAVPAPYDDVIVEVSIPKDWEFRRRANHLVYLRPLRTRTGYPYITVNGEPGGDVQDATEETLQQLADEIRGEVEKESSSGFVLEPEPITIQDQQGRKFQGIHYVVRRSAANTSGDKYLIDQLHLVTAHGGHRYDVELVNTMGMLNDYRPQAYATAAALKIKPKAGKASEPAPKKTAEEASSGTPKQSADQSDAAP